MTTTTTPEALIPKPKPKHSSVKPTPKTPKTLFKPRRPSVPTDAAQVQTSDVCRYEGKGLGLTMKQREPEKYSAIVASLQAGNSLREIASEFNMSKNTAGAIALRELGADFVKRTTVSNLIQLVNACSEDLLSEIDSGNLAATQKAIILGICSDKLLAIEQRQNPSYSLPTVHIQANISDEAVEKLILAATAKHTVSTHPIIDISNP